MKTKEIMSLRHIITGIIHMKIKEIQEMYQVIILNK